MTPCDICQSRGLVRVNYHNGEPYDLGICWCAWGKVYRIGGEALVRQRMELGAAHRVGNLEDFEDEPAAVAVPASVTRGNFLEAGQSAKRKAKL